MSADDKIAFISRTASGHQHINTLTLAPEPRLIILAVGKEARNQDNPACLHLPEVLQKPGPERHINPGDTRVMPGMKRAPAIALEQADEDTFVHYSAKQGVLFTIKRVFDKKAFQQALLTPGAHVVYIGHARYGRGPCFGAAGHGPGDDWEEGSGAHPNADGIYRMGYPFIPVPASEVLHYGYKANLVPSTMSLAGRSAECHPDLRSKLSALSARAAEEIHPGLQPFLRNADPNAKYWTYRLRGEAQVIHIAGWQNTLGNPDEIGAIDPLCRVLCHLGCSTYLHNYPIVRKVKQWTREGNERYAYWTTDTSDGLGPVYWLQHLLTYPKFNAFQSWEPSLKYALAKTNADLQKDGRGYGII